VQSGEFFGWADWRDSSTWAGIMSAPLGTPPAKTQINSSQGPAAPGGKKCIFFCLFNGLACRGIPPIVGWRAESVSNQREMESESHCALLCENKREKAE